MTLNVIIFVCGETKACSKVIDEMLEVKNKLTTNLLFTDSLLIFLNCDLRSFNLFSNTFLSNTSFQTHSLN